jgi:hypothetical protein
MGETKSRFFVAMVVILLVLAVAYAVLPLSGAKRAGAGVDRVQDGNLLAFSCRGAVVPQIRRATYAPVAGASACKPYDVTAWLAAWAQRNPGKGFEVGPDVFPGAPACGGLRELVVTYACVQRPGCLAPAKETVIPRRVDTCTGVQDKHQRCLVLPAAMADPDYALHQWSGTDNANWTAEVTPWDPDSRIQLTTAALTAGARQRHRPINPLTRIGVTDRVPNWDHPYGAGDISSSPCSSAVSVYQVQAFQPGFLVPRANDSTDGTMAERRYYYQPAYWSRASGPYGGPYKPVAACPEDLGIASDFVTDPADTSYETMAVGAGLRKGRQSPPPRDGEYWWQLPGGSRQPWHDDRNERNLAELVGVSVGPYASSGGGARGARKQASFVLPKETLRSRGDYRQAAADDQCLTGIGCGLGSTWIDSRFEPGPQEMYYGGDAIWAHGGHAGGPTFGSFMPAVFQTSGTWQDYVHGFGDGDYVAPVAPRGFRIRA